MKREGAAKENYGDTLDYLFGLQRFGIKLGLDNITALLKHLGDPHVGLRAVHIAGTNGKGSTAAFLAFILRQAGYRVGLYTSPHLVDFTERIQVDGVPITGKRVVQLTEHIRQVVDQIIREGDLWAKVNSSLLIKDFDRQKATITFFEFITAMAFLHFQEARVEVAVLETGMGGKLDATNVIDPLLSLITPISLEHQEYLGKTLLQIAGEKAGIIKPKRPLLTTARQPEVLSLLERKCQELQSPFYAWGRDFRGRRVGPQLMNFQGRHRRWTKLRLGLAGKHQVLNASLALAAAEALIEGGFLLDEEHLRKGLAETKWPGRLELIGDSPRILLDGAHNPGAAEVLKKNLKEDFPRRRLVLVLGIMADKEIPKMMTQLVPLADLLILTRPGMARAASPAQLRSHASSFRKPIVEVAEVSSAVKYALAEAGKEDLIVISGSLFTVGEARAFLVEQGMIPT
jgi:dihydrofolate synthase/folylpolyglutamate synthase